MDNYPDDILDYICQGCREIAPECVCEEVEIEDDESWGDEYE